MDSGSSDGSVPVKETQEERETRAKRREEVWEKVRQNLEETDKKVESSGEKKRTKDARVVTLMAVRLTSVSFLRVFEVFDSRATSIREPKNTIEFVLWWWQEPLLPLFPLTDITHSSVLFCADSLSLTDSLLPPLPLHQK